MAAVRPSIYFLAGDDEFRIKEQAAQLARQLAPAGAGEMGVEIIEASAINGEEAMRALRLARQAVNTVGLFTADKLVWFKNASLFQVETPGGEMVREALKEWIDELAAGVPAGVTVLISAMGVDKRRAYCKTLEKVAATTWFPAPEAGKKAGEQEIAAFIRETLRAENKKLEDDAEKVFRERVAPDLREIANELEKLCIYVGQRRTITAADVRTICSATRQAVIWELTDALGDRHLPRALAAVENLIDNGESAIGIVSTLAGQFRLMLLARDLADRRVLAAANAYDYMQRFSTLPAEATAHLPRTKEGNLPNPWRMFRCAQAARNFTVAELVRALDLLQEAHCRLTSTGLEGRLVLEETIARIGAGRK